MSPIFTSADNDDAVTTRFSDDNNQQNQLHALARAFVSVPASFAGAQKRHRTTKSEPGGIEQPPHLL